MAWVASELLPVFSPHNNSKVNFPNLGLMRSWGGALYGTKAPLLRRITIYSHLQLHHRQSDTYLVPPPIGFIREGVSPASQTMSSTTNPSTLCQTESLESKQGAPKQKKFLFVYFFFHKHYHFVPQNHNLEFFFFTVEAPFGLRLFKMDGCGVTGIFSPVG